ncbi:myosin II light chain, partial [Ophidiomyces ophidiicola]
KVLNRPGGFRDPGEPEEYCRGFQVFDKDMTGFIGVGQLRYILTNLGEKMTDEEVDELLKAVDTSSGEINYTDGMQNSSVQSSPIKAPIADDFRCDLRLGLRLTMAPDIRAGKPIRLNLRVEQDIVGGRGSRVGLIWHF